jgi:hypothetical protein
MVDHLDLRIQTGVVPLQDPDIHRSNELPTNWPLFLHRKNSQSPCLYDVCTVVPLFFEFERKMYSSDVMLGDVQFSTVSEMKYEYV